MIRFYWRSQDALQTRWLSWVARLGLHIFGTGSCYFDLLALDLHFGCAHRSVDAGLGSELDEAEASRAAVLVAVHHECLVHGPELSHRRGEVQFIAGERKAFNVHFPRQAGRSLLLDVAALLELLDVQLP